VRTRLCGSTVRFSVLAGIVHETGAAPMVGAA
jgi:hypothetical protein